MQMRFALIARVGCMSCVATYSLDEWLPLRGRCALGNKGAYRVQDRTRLTGPLTYFWCHFGGRFTTRVKHSETL